MFHEMALKLYFMKCSERKISHCILPFTVLKFKPKLDLKFMLKGSKTIKIMKRSKNRRGLTQVKLYKFLIAYKQTRNIDVLR